MASEVEEEAVVEDQAYLLLIDSDAILYLLIDS
jgi:hypothetical protein